MNTPNKEVCGQWYLRFQHEIRELYSEGVPDYRGKVITAEHVKHYLSSSWQRTLEIVDTVSQWDAPTLLNVGIGYGFPDILLKHCLGREIAGLEVPENIEPYGHLLRAHAIPVYPGMLGGATPSSEHKVDGIIFSEVFEHLRISPLKALCQLRQWVKPGGYLLLTTPNIARLENLLLLLIGKNILEPLPDEDANLEHITDALVHIREYTMNEVTGLLHRAGWVIESHRYNGCDDRRPPQVHRSLVRASFTPLVTFVPRWRRILWIIARNPQ